MIYKSFFVALCLCATTSMAENFECQGIYMAGTGNAAGKPIQFSLHLKSPCIFIKNLKDEKDNKPSTQEKICSLNGKSMYTDYTDVNIIAGEFHDDKLYFEIGLTHLRSPGEHIHLCEVEFINDREPQIKCQKEKSMVDLRPPLSLIACPACSFTH